MKSLIKRSKGRFPDPSFGVSNLVKDRRYLWMAMVLVLSILFVYGPVQHYGFINLDDPVYVADNPHVRQGLTPEGIAWSLTSFRASNWHPMTWLSHMLDVELFGMNAGRHHLTNIVLHILNSLLLLVVLGRLSGNPGSSFVVAALFALNPMNVEAVAWVAQRKTLLCFLFWMLTILAYYQYVRRPAFHRYLWVILFFMLGFSAKPAIVILPFLLMVLDYWPLGRYPSIDNGSDGGRSGFFQTVVKNKIPLLFIALAGGVLTVITQKSGGAVTSLGNLALDVRLANALVSYVKYLGKMIWPHHLAIVYPHPMKIPGWQVVWSSLIVGLISLGAVKVVRSPRSVRSCPYVLVGWLWYVIALVPVIGIVQVGVQAMADRYAYFAFPGLFIAVVWGFAGVSARWRQKRVKQIVVAVSTLLVLGATASKQVETWEDSGAVFTHALSVTDDNYFAHDNLGLFYAGQNRMDDALRHHATAVRINPGYTAGRINLGTVLFVKGDYQKARDQFARALGIDPNHPRGHNNLGAALVKLGDTEQGLRHFQIALRLDPEYVDAHRNIADYLFEQREHHAAMGHYRTILRINPLDKFVHNQLGIILALTGNTDQAIHHFSKALQLDDNFEEARYNMERIRKITEKTGVVKKNKP